jgi:hypothetical protein
MHFVIRNLRSGVRVSAFFLSVMKLTARQRMSEFFILKGQCHEIFDPRFFSLNCTPGSPDSWAKTVLHSNSRRYTI